MIRITKVWVNSAPKHQFVSESIEMSESVYKDIGKTLASPFFVDETVTIYKNTRRAAGLGAIGNAPVNSIVIDGPEELS